MPIEKNRRPDTPTQPISQSSDSDALHRQLLKSKQSAESASHNQGDASSWDATSWDTTSWDATSPTLYKRPERSNNIDANDMTDYSQVFKGIEGKSIEDIIQRIPNVASVRDTQDRTRTIGPSPRFDWYDAKGAQWTVRLHSHQFNNDYWAVRVSRDSDYMDTKGNFHRPFEVANNPKINGDTHIRIPKPDPYISPVTNPKHYGRK